jgi:hypothetical protein
VTGCSQITCSGYDRLELGEVPDATVQPTTDIVIRFEELREAAQTAVRKAASDGSLRQCHYPEDSEVAVLAEDVRRRWEGAEETDTPKGDRTYLLYQGKYYGMRIGLIDVVIMDTEGE